MGSRKYIRVDQKKIRGERKEEWEEWKKRIGETRNETEKEKGSIFLSTRKRK